MKNKTNLIFLHRFFTSIADNMLLVFVPLIVLKQTNNLYLVTMYISCNFLFRTLLNIILKKFLYKYGTIAIMLHIIPIIIMQVILSTCNITWAIILLLAFLEALAMALYYIPLNLLFTFSDKDKNVSKFQIATNVGKLVFIILSGYVLGSTIKNSFWIMTILGTIFYIISIIPIWSGYKQIKESYQINLTQNIVIDKNSYKIYYLCNNSLSIVKTIIDLVIPLYLYVNDLTFASIAIVMALIEVCKIASNLFAKFLLKHKKAFLSCILSIICFLIASTIILIVKVPVVLYICSCMIAISFPLINVPVFKLYCHKLVKDNNQFKGMSDREIYVIASKLIEFVPFFVVPSFIVLFVIGMSGAIVTGVCCKKITADYYKQNQLAEAEQQ